MKAKVKRTSTGMMKKKYTYKGKRYLITELGKIGNLSWRTLHARLETLKWSVEKSVETPVRRGGNPIYKPSFSYQVSKAIDNWKDVTEAACVLFQKKHNMPRKMKWRKVKNEIEEMRRMQIAA